ncbi:MAG TPA: hypothetical protein DCS93_40040 [Microscillaceae bacterium]|nr:hypothetical protein [Microscillaceae bacterium]
MLHLYFVRHAESLSNVNHHLIGGRSNHTPLTEKGIQQAKKLGERLATTAVKLDVVAASSAVRAYDTAKIMCERANLDFDQVLVSDELQELSQGDWEGKVRKEIYTPQMLSQINSNNWLHKAPNGESQKEVEERMFGWMEKHVFPLNDPDQAVHCAIVTHGNAIRCLFRKIMNSTPSMTHRIKLDNTSITKFRYAGDKDWYLDYVNDHEHLDKSTSPLHVDDLNKKHLQNGR